MKISFFLALGAIVAATLMLLSNSFISNNILSIFLAAYFVLAFLSILLMLKSLDYETALQESSILEDVYSCNVASFNRRLSRRVWIDTVCAIINTLTIFMIGIDALKSEFDDWIGLALMVMITLGAIIRSVKIMKAHYKLKANASPEQCMNIAEDIYKLDYSAYYEARQYNTCESILPPRPRHFNVFLWFSIVMASIATLYGLVSIISGAFIMLTKCAVEFQSWASLLLLYGSFAIYFGVKDFITIVQSFRHKSKSLKNNET